ncbi:outer membrane protein [Jiella sp. M17.18]|uniref:outer membrane protein n=1 Tax=Jiella sp. M17.18 TaxID=3234247 RepID=UPI0034DEDCB2
MVLETMRAHLSIRAIAAAAAFLLGAVSARAADLPAAAAPPAPLGAPAEPIHIWTGPYAGAFVGYNMSHYDQSGGASFSGDGFVGGVYTGLNFQSGPLVYGIEGDLGGAGVSGDGFNSTSTARIDANENIFGSLRARVGVPVDPFLVFATGGLAIANNKLSLGGVSDTKTAVGYTLGAGVEAKITDDVSARLEYRFSDYGKEKYDLGNTSVSSGFDEHSIRAGIALKF